MNNGRFDFEIIAIYITLYCLPDSPKTPEASGHNSPGTPKSPASRAAAGKPPSTGNEIKKIAVIRSTPKSPKNRSPTSLSAAAPLPDLKNVRSKIRSTDNLKHQPGGGQVIHLELIHLNVLFAVTFEIQFKSHFCSLKIYDIYKRKKTLKWQQLKFLSMIRLAVQVISA